MLRLNFKRDPKWIDLGFGVKVEAMPYTTTLYAQAVADFRKDLEAEGLHFGEAEDDEQDAILVAAAIERRQHLWGRSCARAAITDWDGVGDEDGQPVGLTREGLDALLDVPEFSNGWHREYIIAHMEALLEGNASPLSLDGTLPRTGAVPTAPDAEDDAQTAPMS